MRITCALACGCLLALAGGTALQADDAKKAFVPADLTGWEGLPDYWSVHDGALVGATPKGLSFNTFLCSKKPYQNFEMKFQVRLKGGTGNSGVQIRSAVFDLTHYAVMGPQCDMGDIYWGSLYGEHFGGMMKQAPKDVVQNVLKKDDFNDYSIRCEGKHVTIMLNGEKTVDADFPQLPDTGLIAFQLHAGKPMEVTFRNIQFKELKK